MKVIRISLDMITVVGKMKELGKKRENRLGEELKHLNREIEEIEKQKYKEVETVETVIEREGIGEQENLFGENSRVFAERERRVVKKEQVENDVKDEFLEDFLKRLKERKFQVELMLSRSRFSKKEEQELDTRVLQMLRGERDGFGQKIGLYEQIVGEGFWLHVREQPDYKSPVYNWQFKIGDHTFVQVNTGVDRKGNNFRIEWNPNLVEDWEQVYIYEMLEHIDQKRFTKIDLAMDIETNLSRWKIIDELARKQQIYNDGQGRLQTRECGTRYSDVQTVIYNKQQERKDKANEEINKTWWRIEERIKGDAVKDWENHEWFSGVRLVKGNTGYRKVDEIDFPEEMKPNEIAQIVACIVKPDLIERYAKGTKAKIRKKIEELARFEEIETEFRPCEYVKEKMSSDLAEIKKTLEKIINL